MTTLQNTTVLPAQFVAAVPPVIAAQRAGDEEYDAVLALTHDGELASVAYHLAYQRLARVPGGCGPVCGCNLCRDEFNPVVAPHLHPAPETLGRGRTAGAM